MFFCNSNILEQFVFHSSPSLLWVAAAVNCLEGVQKIIIRFPATVLPWLNKTYSCSLVCLDQSLIATATTPSPTRSSLSAVCPPANLGSVFALCEASFLQLPSVFNSPRWSYLFYHLRSPLLPVPSIMPASVKVPWMNKNKVACLVNLLGGVIGDGYLFQVAYWAPGLLQQPLHFSSRSQFSFFCSSTSQPATLSEEWEIDHDVWNDVCVEPDRWDFHLELNTKRSKQRGPVQ